MTTFIKIVFAFALALFLSSCVFDINFGEGTKGNGKIVKDTREITGEFTIVSASEGIEVYVSQTTDFSIEVEADENIIDLIGTEIKNGKLRIHTIKNIGNAIKKVYVSLPEVTALRSSSGSHLTAENVIKSDKLDIDVSSGAILKAELAVDDVEIDASSGANLNISGEADTADVDVSSGGNINAKKLGVKICNAEASSGGNISIKVTKSLTADASSGGNISYSGDPSVQKSKSLSGSVHRY